MLTLSTTRLATPVDTPEIAVLLNEIIAIGGTTAFEDPVTPENMGAWYLDAPTAFCCHVAVDSAGAIAGFQALETGAESGIGNISTFARQTPAVKGVGTALFAATEAWARAGSLMAIDAKIRADNRSGLAYYTKMGFLDRSVFPGVPLKDGTPVDRILKRYHLA